MEQIIANSLIQSPSELNNALIGVVNDVTSLASSGTRWAKQAVAMQAAEHAEDPKNFGKQGIIVSTERMRELCSDLFLRVIDPAFEQAKQSCDIGKPLKMPDYIGVDAKLDSPMAVKFRDGKTAIFISLNYLGARHSFAEMVSDIAHEFGHLHEFSSNKSFKANYEAEYYGDRAASPIKNISSLLTDLCNSFPEDLGDGVSHPSHFKRIRASLEQALSNDIFGTNGNFIEQDGYHHFVPNTLDESSPEVKKKFLKTIQNKVVPDIDKKYPVTSDGKLVANWDDLQQATEQKSTELILLLKEMSKTYFSREKKQEWLSIVEAEIAKFKETHKPEFVETENLRDVHWRDKMQRNSPRNQRG